MSPSTVGAQSFNHLGLAEQTRRVFILPGYQRLQERIQQLQLGVGKLCASPSFAQLDVVRKTYRSTIDAWGRVDLIKFGPITERNRLERMFFWPDRKGIGSRQVRRLLKGAGTDKITAGSLVKMSVAVQGLTALEILLFGKGSSDMAVRDKASRRCHFVQAITDNLSNIMEAVVRSWSDGGRFARIWASPGASNPVYLQSSELTLEIVKALDQSLESVRERKIVPALGLGRTRRRHRPILWRSKLGMVLIHANMLGAKSLFEDAGLARTYLDSQEDRDEARSTLSSIESEFKLVLRATAPLAAMPDPFSRPDIKRRLIVVGFPLKSLRLRGVPLIKAAAGLAIGFNASDGD